MQVDALRNIWLAFADLVAEHKDELNALDAAIGDADHGTNLDRGLQKVKAQLLAEDPQDFSALVKKVGMTLLSTVGGASGALWGSSLLKAAQALPAQASVGSEDLFLALDALIQAMLLRGHAQLGDKTMMDVWLPLQQDLKGMQTFDWDLVVDKAAKYAEATIPLEAKRGRAAYLGPRSVGHLDPGARSTALFWQAVAGVKKS